MTAFESNPSGMIRQDFLENEVMDGFEKVKSRTMELTDNANNIINNVSDLVTVDRIDDTEVLETVERGKKKVRSIVEELHTLDKTQVKAMESVRADLQTMRSYLSDMESKVERGDLSIVGFNLEAVRNIDGYSAMMDRIYGEEEWKVPRDLLEKMANGKHLTPYERDILYDYFQNDYLNAETKKEAQEIASLISEDNIDLLKDRLNNVIMSKGTIEKEMAIVQAYIYNGTNRPDEHNLKRETKQKLDAYLVLLKNIHQSSIGVAKVESLDYKDIPENVRVYRFESTIQSAPYRSADRGEMNMKEYREFALRDNGLDSGDPWKVHTDIKVNYFRTVDANVFRNYLETQKLKEEDASYTFNYILDLAVNGLYSQLGAGAFLKAEEFASKKEELERNIQLEEAGDMAAILDLEYAVSNSHTYPGAGPDFDRKLDIEFYPTKDTYKFLDRWEMAYGENPEIPYPPEELLQSEKWYEIGEFWLLHHKEIREDHLYDYIRGGD